MWLLICLFGNRLLFCFMARSTLSFWWSARFIFGPVLCPFLRALRNLCQQRRCSFVSVGSEIFAQWLTDDGWQQGRASRTLLMRFKQGQVFYMQCAYLWLTACMSQCDPSHQTLARDMSQSTYHSDMNGWAPPLILFFTAGGPGAVGLDRDLGSLWNRRNSHTLTFHRSITCHCCHWKLFFLLTVLRLAWVFRHFCNTLSWGKHFRSQWRI